MGTASHEDSDGTGYCRGCGTTIGESHHAGCGVLEALISNRRMDMPRELHSLSEQYGPGADDDDVYMTIDTEAKKLGLSDMDVWCAWKLGLAAYQKVRDLGARFPHDSQQEQ